MTCTWMKSHIFAPPKLLSYFKLQKFSMFRSGTEINIFHTSLLKSTLIFSFSTSYENFKITLGPNFFSLKKDLQLTSVQRQNQTPSFQIPWFSKTGFRLVELKSVQQFSYDQKSRKTNEWGCHGVSWNSRGLEIRW